MSLSTQDLAQLDANFRAANYLSVAQLYLRENALLREPLRPQHIKARLLGHWGTVPGINLVYTHLSRMIRDTGRRALFIAGTGHGAPGVLSHLYLEGTLGEVYPRFGPGLGGLTTMVREFSWPGGMPSHLTALTPGTLHEGGELGYSLSHAFGAALDKPDLLVACLIGDGEAETGPLAAAWQSINLMNPATDGAVLPILHLNGYKLSGPSVPARLTREQLASYFAGLGYRVCEVAGDDPSQVHADMAAALEWATTEIAERQHAARTGRFPDRPDWPMLILRTPKGWTDPKTLDGKPLEDTVRSHQVPVDNPASNPKHLRALEAWMRSYRPEALFDKGGYPTPLVTAVYPQRPLRMGRTPEANGGAICVPLILPDYGRNAVEVTAPGQAVIENTKVAGWFLRDVVRANAAARNFRVVCPDETSSNRLQAIFEATGRAWALSTDPSDENLSRDGRVMELLSEHCCQGWLEGYVLSGRHGLFACYEAFLSVVDSMMQQYAKWTKMACETAWRAPVASLNYLVTSHVWEQDHNGYSHQGPNFINLMLTKKAAISRVYLPPDANCLLSVTDHCLRSRNYINLIVASKKPMPQWLDIEAARRHCTAGAAVWDWASNDEGNPDVILAAAGDVPTREVMAAAWWLRQSHPRLKVRVVNVVDLFRLQSPQDHPHGMTEAQFTAMFGREVPVVFAFHGYPSVIHELLHHRPNATRFHVRGYVEEGTTTTPFDMTVLNGMSRNDLAIEALRRAGRGDDTGLFDEKLRAHRAYIREHDEDMPEVQDWRWTPFTTVTTPHPVEVG